MKEKVTHMAKRQTKSSMLPYVVGGVVLLGVAAAAVSMFGSTPKKVASGPKQNGPKDDGGSGNNGTTPDPDEKFDPAEWSVEPFPPELLKLP
ncbi:hypothetical protein [Nannocystis pusilla]|uniref:hypothetical protein n=1 Tax=Nannocystis pusilla TaxID=889268 RepID=UPI003B78FB9B